MAPFPDICALTGTGIFSFPEGIRCEFFHAVAWFPALSFLFCGLTCCFYVVFVSGTIFDSILAT